MNDKEEYQKYLEAQSRKSKKTKGRTVRNERKRQWIYDKMKEFNVEGETMLCVGARHCSEVEFFEKRGFKVDGIDLFEDHRIIKCDMSKMVDHPYIGYQRYDIVFCNDVLEHCWDLDGFIKGLNKLCNKYFVFLGPSSTENEPVKRVDWWDCSIHKFMIGIKDKETFDKNILETFNGFEIVTSVVDIKRNKLFWILKKKVI